MDLKDCKKKSLLLIRLYVGIFGSEMILNCRVIVERYSFLNGVVGDLILAVKFSLYVMEKTN
jgi:hypothetical protein